MNKGSGPVVLRRRVGITLRALRMKAGVTPQQAADVIRSHPSKISRMENGQSPLRERDVCDLLDLYGLAGGPERNALLDDVRAASRPTWWQRYRDTVPSWELAYLGLETDASQIRCYAPYTVPDLLQTDSYAAALRGGSHLRAQAARLSELRATRQELVRRPGRALWAVIDESALLRPAGGRDIMREQIASLITAAKTPGVAIQVLRLSAGAWQGGGTAFTLLRFGDPALPEVVYTETPVSGGYTDRAEDVDQYRYLADRLGITAEPCAATPDILAALL